MYFKFFRISRSNLRQEVLSFKNYIRKAHNNAVPDIDKIRNIGILAHIDAGKTTTTERMLFFSGSIGQMGEVHHGNTVTDFMEQERERGITITSAAVTFLWDKYRYNLIDTPGHIDFTMEVEQSLSVLDGAIVILDASAGVEAQTVTVWQQADKHNVVRLVYVNKMDRPDANLPMCIESVQRKFSTPVIGLQLPIVESQKLVGLVDIIGLDKLMWKSGTLMRTALSEKDDGDLWERSSEARERLVDELSGVDDVLADIVIAKDSLDAIAKDEIMAAVARTTKERKVVPVLCGSSYKNIGVEPLLDAIGAFLPSPIQTVRHRQFAACFGERHLSAHAFKVMHDKRRGGPLVFLRLYAGTLKRGQRIFRARDQASSEQCGRIYAANADELEEIQECATAGNIVVATGLKEISAGDIVTDSASARDRALNVHNDENASDKTMILRSLTKIPDPVFFCSIEPPSMAYQAGLDTALAELAREDPSLRVLHNAETGQTVLSGMGELHLDIIRDRILKEYKIAAALGPLQIAYREIPLAPIRLAHATDMKIGTSKQFVSVELSIIPQESKVVRELVELDKTKDAAAQLSHVTFKTLSAVKQGAQVGINYGPKIGAQIYNTSIMLHRLQVGRGTSSSVISATVTQCIQKMLKECETKILEPVMLLEITLPDEYSSTIISNLSQKRSVMKAVDARGDNKVIIAETPLVELLGYSKTIRTLTSGTATFSMEFLEYQPMSLSVEAKAIESVRGF